MTAFDSSNVSGSPLSKYNAIVENAKADAAAYEKHVRTEVVGEDQVAEKQANASFKDLQYAKGIFDIASGDKYTLEQQLKKLEQEKESRIRKAREENRDKNPDQIKQICDNIAAEYTDRITNLKFSISEANTTAHLKHDTLFEAQKSYQNDRFASIATSNNVWSGFLEASRRWLNVGYLQKHQQFLQTQYDNIQNNKGFDVMS